MSKLIAADFRAFPVWEYAIDEEGKDDQDETWVRPVACKAIRKGTYSQIIATDVTTSTDRRLQGFMIATTADGRVEISAGAVVDSVGYHNLPQLSRKLAVRRKAFWDVDVRDALLAALHDAESDVFPIRYVLRVPNHGEKQRREGILR